MPAIRTGKRRGRKSALSTTARLCSPGHHRGRGLAVAAVVIYNSVACPRLPLRRCATSCDGQSRLPVMITFRLGTSFTAPASVQPPSSTSGEWSERSGSDVLSLHCVMQGLPWRCWRRAASAFQRYRFQTLFRSLSCFSSCPGKACTFSRISPLHLEIDGCLALPQERTDNFATCPCD